MHAQDKSEREGSFLIKKIITTTPESENIVITCHNATTKTDQVHKKQ